MNGKECLQLLRTIKDVAFATVDKKGKPQVRIIDVMMVEKDRLYFCTARGKDFYEQLMEQGDVAIVGMNEKYQMVRLSGKVARLTEQKQWIDRIFDENPSMKEVYPGQARYILEPFCMEQGEMEFFDLGKTPIYRESFAMGQEIVKEKGYVITEKCIGCGKCKKFCPQQCIIEESPYEIQQENCLHCGLCYEGCPVQAIERRGV